MASISREKWVREEKHISHFLRSSSQGLGALNSGRKFELTEAGSADWSSYWYLSQKGTRNDTFKVRTHYFATLWNEFIGTETKRQVLWYCILLVALQRFALLLITLCFIHCTRGDGNRNMWSSIGSSIGRKMKWIHSTNFNNNNKKVFRFGRKCFAVK